MTQSQKMRRALNRFVIPKIEQRGFEGTYPHFKKVYEDRFELLSFYRNNRGNSFTVEFSTVFMPQRKRDSNFISTEFKNIKNADFFDTNVRYRLKGMFDGWFYYTDVYRRRIRKTTFYTAVSENKSKIYMPAENEVLVQKADDGIYEKICEEVNKQMVKRFVWLNAFDKNNKIKMMILERF